MAKSVADIVHVVAEYAKRTTDLLTNFYGQLSTAIQERVVPALHKAATNIVAVLNKVHEEFVNLALAITERAIKAVRQFAPDLAKIGKPLAELGQQVAESVDHYFQWASREYKEIYELLAQSVRELPGLEYLQDKLKEVSAATCRNIKFSPKNHLICAFQISGGLIVPEHVVRVLKEVVSTLKELLPTTDAKEFVDRLAKYIENVSIQSPFGFVKSYN